MHGEGLERERLIDEAFPEVINPTDVKGCLVDGLDAWPHAMGMNVRRPGSRRTRPPRFGHCS